MVRFVEEVALPEDNQQLITTDNVSWSFKKSDERVVIKCTPIKNYEKWWCLALIRIWSKIARHATVAAPNVYNHLHPKQVVLDEDVLNYPVYVELTMIHFYGMELNLSLVTPAPNISDCQLIINNQMIYVCKKILAQYSTYFYDLFATDKECYTITDISYDDVMMIVEMIYSNGRYIKFDKYDKLCELSLQFGAYQCMDECEKYLIRQNHEKAYAMKCDKERITKFGYKVLDKVQRNLILYYRTMSSPLHFATEERQRFDENTGEQAEEKRERMKEFEEKSFEIVLGEEVLKREDIYRKKFRAKWNGLTFWISFSNIGIKIRSEYENDSHPWNVKGRVCLVTGTRHNPDTFDLSWMDNETHIGIEQEVMKYDKIYIIGLLSGIFPTYNVNLNLPRYQLSDVILSVGDKKYHVSRQILAYQSRYFERLFYSNYMESKSSDIELIGIDGDELNELIQHIYDPMRRITDDYIDGLSILADMYMVQHVVDKCQKYREIFEWKDDEIEVKTVNSTPEWIKSIINDSDISEIDPCDNYTVLELPSDPLPMSPGSRSDDQNQ